LKKKEGTKVPSRDIYQSLTSSNGFVVPLILSDFLWEINFHKRTITIIAISGQNNSATKKHTAIISATMINATDVNYRLPIKGNGF
jgi:hypothetical protein